MLHRIIVFACLFFTATFCNAQKLQSPDEFLGYPLGQKFTQHSNIVRYFESAAAAAPQMMKLEKYGQTYEGRPLMIAVISSPENFSRLDEIRKNNLRLTGLLNDKDADLNGPAIVWLSYNVHGNEPSSSEVSMKVLYELLSGKKVQLTQWLQHTVVIIDPCLNPDGRDRYVNWFTQVSGKFPDANPESREHNEPWPGGRTNHYNFDLNRDWAWQTQTESQARLKIYQQWMPEIHCDFHEQYPGSPYYFAPAAEPVHEAITQWQKDFQVTVGKNHARYFDQNGWLYFTKQYFDLFYPSYGDTYPLFNGSIGMTYEQAGHSPGGVMYAMGNGDTLTLSDRIAHHFTTSLSTIEAASDNNAKLVASFKKYFDDNRAGAGSPYKYYVVSNDRAGAVASLKELLAKNDISFGYATENRTMAGFNYFSGSNENISVHANDIVVPAAQPKGSLLRVLFERESKLSDSATYDITAWSLPFAYGLKTFAVKEAVPFQQTANNNQRTTNNIPSDAYGYIVPMNSFSDSKFLSAVLEKGIKVRYSETPFSFNNVNYREGSLIILRKGNEDKISEMLALAASCGSNISAISSGYMQSGFDFGSDKIHLMKNPAVALVTGEGASSAAAGEVWHLFEQQLNRPITLVNANDLGNTDLKNYKVIIIADGYYKFLGSKESSADLKQWIKDGGKLILTENAANQASSLEWGFKLKKAEEKDDSLYAAVKKYADRDRQSVVNNIPGAVYKMQLDNTHPVDFGYPEYYYTLKQNDNVYEFLKDGWNIGTIRKQKQVAGFVGSRVKENVKDGVLIGEMPMGKGSVVFFADDPIFRSFWENGKMMFCNAIFY